MHVIEGGRRTLVALGLLAAIGAAGCSASPAPGPAASGSSPAASPAATAPAAPPATSPAASGTASASPDGVQNLVVSSAIRSQLTAAYEAARRIKPSDVAGNSPSPGSVYYAHDPATDTYWALARFGPGRTASLNVQVGFQDGGAYGMFTRAGTGTWRVRYPGIPFVCGEVQFFPQAVLAAWSLPTSPPAGMVC